MALDIPATHADLLQPILPHLGRNPDCEVFAILLYSRTARDGLEPYSAQMLADLAKQGFEFLLDKPRGRHKIRARHVAAAGDGARPAISVLEVLNDDMPFLVDSVMGEIQHEGLAARLVLHPIFKTRRSGDGRLEALLGPGDQIWDDGRQESYITVYLDPLDEAAAQDLAASLSAVLDEVRIAVTDWQTMLARLDRAVSALETMPPPVAPGLLSETLAFCRWLRDGHFTFLGTREFRLAGGQDSGDLVPVTGSGLGVLRDPSMHVLNRGGRALAMTPEIRRFFFAPEPLIISKSNILSRIHRRSYMDYVGIKTYDRAGALSGELRIVGLLTSGAYTQPPSQIPLLRRKVETVLAQSGFPPASHAGKTLAHVLDTFPRDELFQIEEDMLKTWANGILDLDLRPRVAVFVRPDRFDRFVSALVYVPRDRFSSRVRERIGQALADAYDGRVTTFTPFFTEGPLVRVHFIIERGEGPRPEVPEAGLEAKVAGITRTWDDQLATAMEGAGLGTGLVRKYARAFSAGYEEMFSPARALEDIARIERLGPDRSVAIDFYCEDGMPRHCVRAAVYRFDEPIPLSERVPVLENLGFSVIDERSYRITPRLADGLRRVALHDMVLETQDRAPIDLDLHGSRMEECFLAVVRGEADNDAFNRLIVGAGADWREAAMIRACAVYLRQVRSPFGLRYIADTLNRHAGMARDLVELFRARFDPGRTFSMDERGAEEAQIKKRIEGALAHVPSLDEDRILRHILSVISAAARTNFFQRDSAGRFPVTLAFKLVSKDVEGLPDPRPFREIWVYSPRVEGIHLRFAPIARGGIRWSDRAQDFRTEVLDLAKAQQVKNAVIVPQGAKGGFVPKQMLRSGAREEVMKEGTAAYRLFVSALLTLTDNIRAGAVVPPELVVRHDADDPYLVVAADKGTATFSDLANAIALEGGFWLGDAFASGGSAGYDHKKMAITSRGAWECIKRHFRQMDLDIQSEPFRVVGVGDMSGDVFGNGMLLSPCIRLVAAFDHRDIFIDPDPDPAQSLSERRRLFELPRSSWQDYDKSKISKGGGVFPRTAKSIALSPEIRGLLKTNASSMTPAELIRAVLKCETDLLWFGGIGTYVRASAETDEQVGDRVNDGVRVAAAEINAKVIGEGANLALTQRARIECARRGSRLNTDFIDNSAGVNCSDQEVNIKIALGPAVGSGRLAARERLGLLASMTEDVASACLVNNYQQSLALSLAERRSVRDIGYLGRLVLVLENRALLDRALEALPSEADTAARQAAGQGFTRPELAVLLSYAKIALRQDLLASSMLGDAACQPVLIDYFPPALRIRYRDDLAQHRLGREIVATSITNAMINRGGPAMAVRLADETGRGAADIAYAFMAVRTMFGLQDLWRGIDELDGKISGAFQLELYARTQDLVIAQTAGLLRRGGAESSAHTAASDRAGVERVGALLAQTATARQRRRLEAESQRYRDARVPPRLAESIAALDLVGLAPAILQLAHDAERPLEQVAEAVFAAADYLRSADLAQRLEQLAVSDYYDRLAINGALGTLETAVRALAREVLAAAGAGIADFAAWEQAHAGGLARAKAALDEMADAGDITVSRLTVVASRVRDLVGA